MFSSLFFCILFYGLFIWSISCDNGKEHIRHVFKQLSFVHIISIGILLIFSILFCIYQVEQNEYIYYWDYAGYWAASIDRMNYMFEHSFIDNITSLHLSINADDYNLFLPTLIAFSMKLCGYSFTKYVLICFVMFLIPTFFIQSLIVTKMITNNMLNKGNLFVIAFALSVCFAGNYYALFRGFIDVAFLVPISAAMYLFIDYDFSKKSITRNCAIALMLVIT